MSLERRTINPGRRERRARKRHRRAIIWFSRWGAEAEPLKVSHRHRGRLFGLILAVSDSRNAGRRHALESARRLASNNDDTARHALALET